MTGTSQNCFLPLGTSVPTPQPLPLAAHLQPTTTVSVEEKMTYQTLYFSLGPTNLLSKTPLWLAIAASTMIWRTLWMPPLKGTWIFTCPLRLLTSFHCPKLRCLGMRIFFNLKLVFGSISFSTWWNDDRMILPFWIHLSNHFIILSIQDISENWSALNFYYSDTPMKSFFSQISSGHL